MALRRALVLVPLLAAACSVGDRYLVAPETLATIQSLPVEARPRTAAPAARKKGGETVWIRSDAFSLPEARPQGDVVEIPTRMRSRRIQLGHALVWTGTPLSIAGLCMVIWGTGAVRWSGIALSAVAEPLMIAGTVVWIRAARSRPQELPPAQREMTYLPAPGTPSAQAPRP